jgi:hypothetical protein
MPEQLANESSGYLWLDKILPTLDVDYEHYATCEREVITPALIEAGYAVLGGWRTGDGDSFGPLTRCVSTDHGTVFYE